MSYLSSLYNLRNAQTPEGKKRATFLLKKNSDKKGTKDSKGSFFQVKLSVNGPGDKHQQETDTVTDAVVNNKSAGQVPKQQNISRLQRRLATSKENEKLSTNDEKMKHEKDIQRVADPEKEKEVTTAAVQKKSGAGGASTASPVLSSKIESLAAKGSSLSKNTLQEMNTSFGSDFINVKIHNYIDSAAMNKELNNHDFTHGNNIYL